MEAAAARSARGPDPATAHRRLCVGVTGAGGGIGRAVLRALSPAHDIRGLFRRESPTAEQLAAAGGTVVRGDLEDDSALQTLVRGTDCIIHCAAAVTRQLGRARRINVEASRRLAEFAAQAGCRRFVYLSSIAAYLGNPPVDGCYPESAPVQANRRMDLYSRTKLQGEQAVREVAARTSMELVVLRPTCVYGPGVDSWTVIPWQAVSRGLPLAVGRRGEIDVIYVDDVARAVALAATHPAAAGQTYNLGGQSLLAVEFLNYYARPLGRQARWIPSPWVSTLVNIGAPVHQVIPFPAAVEPNRLRLVQFCMDGTPGKPKFPSTRIHQDLGFEPAVPLSEGMLRTQFWLEDNQQITRRRTFEHWERNYTFSPKLTLLPESEGEVRAAVQRAVQTGRRVKAIGSLHSMAALPTTADICLVLERMARPVSTAGDLVTVQAGIKLKDLNSHLAGLGLALPIQGAFAEQTISGAVSTGTHGGSTYQGGLASSVEAVRLVTGEGELLSLNRDDERFYGAVLSAGLCGVLTEVTLRCVPAFWLRSSNEVLPFDEVLRQFSELQTGSPYCDMTWFPIVDQVEVMRSERLPGPIENRELKPARPPRIAGWMRPLARTLVRWLEHGRLQGLQRRMAAARPGWFYPSREGRSDFVLAYQQYQASRIPTADFEAAVPVARAGEALLALRDHFRSLQRYPFLGVRIRCQQAEPYWLSGAFERDVCWLELFQVEPAADFLRAVHQVLAPFDYRPHWGKNLPTVSRDWPRLYPRWNDYQRLRQSLDPQGLCLNAYVESVGLSGVAQSLRHG